MKLTKLILSDFFSFGMGQVIDFTNYENLVLVKGQVEDGENSNGSGKSSLFEAVYWCLTGKTVRGVKAGDVVRIGKNKVEVTVEFTHKDMSMCVTRIWTEAKKELILVVNGEIERFHDIKQGTQRLFELIGITPEILSLIGFYGRKFNTFSDLSPKQRAEVVDLLAQGQKWEAGRETAAKRARDLERDYQASSLQTAKLETRCLASEADLRSLKEELTIFEKKQAAEIAEFSKLRDEASTKSLKLGSLVIQGSEVIDFKNEIGVRLTAVTAEKDKELEVFIQEKKNENDEADIKSSETEKLIDDLNAEIYTIGAQQANHKTLAARERRKKGKSVCGECNQTLPNPPDNEAIEQSAVKHDTLVVEAGKEIAEMEIGVSDLRAALSEERSLQRSQAQKFSQDIEKKSKPYSVKIDALYLELAEFKKSAEASIAAADKAEQFLKNCELELKLIENSPEKARILTSLEHKNGQIDQILKDKAEIETSMKQVNMDRQLSKYWAQGFKDLRFAAFENTIKTLEDLLNAFCSQQGLDFDSIEVTSFKENSAGKTTPEINIYVIRDGNRMGIDALSEGETQRVDLACFFTFSLLIEKSLGFPVDFNVLDEPLAGLDYEGRQLVFNIISDLSKDRQIFTIDHDANFQDLFNSVITVKKDKGVSEINQKV